MLSKKFSILMIATMLTIVATAQDSGPGGLGTSGGDGSGDVQDGVQDVDGGTGTTGGVEGVDSVPIDGQIVFLFALGALLLVKTAYSYSNKKAVA